MCFWRKKKSTDYGKIFAVTVAIVAGTCAVACVVFKLLEKHFNFCTSEDYEDYLDDADLEEVEGDDEVAVEEKDDEDVAATDAE